MAKMGRPIKYEPSMCDKVMPLMEQGASIAEVAAELGVAISTLTLWREQYPDLSAAIKRGIDASQSWWEKHGRIQLENRDFNATLWYMNMKNRFNWRDKTENEHTGKDGAPLFKSYIGVDVDKV